MNDDYELRVTLERLALRAMEDGRPHLVGYAAVYNSRSLDLGGFVEIIRPGAFRRTLSAGADVRALVNHDPTLIIGRHKAGTLQLVDDERGLKVDIAPPDTQTGRDIIENVRVGNIDGMSFAFRTIKDSWDVGVTPALRELLDVDLRDVSPVTYPAYPKTDIALRALEQARTTRVVVPEVEAESRMVPMNPNSKMCPMDTPWSAPTLSDFTDKAWGDLTDGEKNQIARHFAYAPAMPPEAFGDLKLPHHRPSDGAMVFRGVVAAAGRLSQTNIPDKAAVKAHLRAHYKQAGEDPPDSLRAEPEPDERREMLRRAQLGAVG